VKRKPANGKKRQHRQATRKSVGGGENNFWQHGSSAAGASGIGVGEK
jgi:hypothetical protein